jgi:hypothetical protein
MKSGISFLKFHLWDFSSSRACTIKLFTTVIYFEQLQARVYCSESLPKQSNIYKQGKELTLTMKGVNLGRLRPFLQILD